MKFIEQSTEKIVSESAVKAHLIGGGSGTLGFIDNTIKFHIEKGRIRKQQEQLREIPMSDIDAITRVGNELSITWRGTMDIFVIENTEFFGSIFEKIANTFEEEKKLSEEKKIVKQQSNDDNKIVYITMEIIDPLFDILRSLHGWVDWNRIENLLKKSAKESQELTDQKINGLELDFSKLTIAIEERTQEETSKESLNLLKLLYDYFVGKDSEDETLKEIHPNFHDAKTTIQAYYLLNDIILGVIVGDRVEKETNSLMVMLEDLSMNTYLEININALKDSIDKMGADQEKVSVIEENKAVFRKQLEDYKTIESTSFVKPVYPSLKPSNLLRAKKFFWLVCVSVSMRVRVFCVKLRKRIRK